jgi:hypothetical protein
MIYLLYFIIIVLGLLIAGYLFDKHVAQSIIKNLWK